MFSSVMLIKAAHFNLIRGVYNDFSLENLINFYLQVYSIKHFKNNSLYKKQKNIKSK